MKESEIINIINKIENEFPVDKWVINKIHIWPLIRIELRFKLYYWEGVDKPKDIAKLIRYINRFILTVKNIFKYTYAYLADFKHNDTIGGPIDIIFLTRSFPRTLFNGLYYDRLCGPFVDIFQGMDMKTLTLEMTETGDFHQKYCIPRYKPSVFIQQRIHYLIIKNRLFRKKTNPEDEKLDGFSDFVKFLESNNYGIISPNIQDLRYQVGIILEITGYFKKIFSKIKPSIAFVADYCLPVGFAFNLACRQAGIPSVDIQHGLAGEYHPSYGRWNKIPEGGFEVLPAIFWCWSEEEANAILKWNKDVSNLHRPFIGGNLWLNLWKKQNDNIVKYYDNQIMQIKAKSNKSVFILYTLGMFYSTPEWLYDAIKLSSDSFHWWIRLHYSQLDKRKVARDFFKKRGITNVEFDQAADFPLPALLRHTDLHITTLSATIIDAKSFGVPSIFIHEDGIKFLSKEIISGMATYVRTKEELLEAIRLQLGRKNKIQATQEKEPPCDNSSIIKKFLAEVGINKDLKWTFQL